MLGQQQPYHLAGEKYLTAVLDGGRRPAADRAGDRAASSSLEELFETLDGLLFMGSPSNVEPRHYRGEPSEDGTLHDPHRDETTLPLIPRAVAAGVPVLGICRGFQEMNVAFGGSLWQKLQEVPGSPGSSRGSEAAARAAIRPGARGDARARRSCCGAWPAPIVSRVNSLHGQGVRELGAGLAVEARAPDGVIEAFRVEQAPAVRAGGAVASGVAVARQSVLARAVRRIRRRAVRGAELRTRKNEGDLWRTKFNSSSAITASPRSRRSFPIWPASRAARSCRRRNSPRTRACGCPRASSCRP